MKNLIIVAAGKGSRLDLSIPKALVKIREVENVTNTLLKCRNLFDSIFIVTNNELSEDWNRYFSSLREKYPLMKHVHEIRINSGMGDGHAVLESLKSDVFKNNKSSDSVCIMWGDAYISSFDIICELWIKYYHRMCSSTRENVDSIIPCVHEKNPYVLFTAYKKIVEDVRFSKLGEVSKDESGHHDQSIFVFRNYNKLKDDLLKLHDKYFSEGKYNTINNELSLLSVFKHSEIDDSINLLYETKYPTQSFNTIEELNNIELKK